MAVMAATTAMVMMVMVHNIFFTAGMKPRNPCFLSESSLTPSLIWNGNAEERRFASQKPLPEPWLFHREVSSFDLIIGSQTFGFPGPALGPPGTSLCCLWQQHPLGLHYLLAPCKQGMVTGERNSWRLSRTLSFVLTLPLPAEAQNFLYRSPG